MRGTPGGFPAASNPGINTPRSRLANGCWTIYNNIDNAVWNLTSLTNTNSLVMGALSVTGPGHPDFCNQPIMKPEELWNIDTKMDDGRPGQGNIITYNTAKQANCTTSNDPATSAYNLSFTSNDCAVVQLLR